MNRKIVIALLIIISLISCKQKPVDKMEWWRDAKFGMFIHWGLYSVPAGEYDGKEIGGIGEWIMNNADIPVDTYANYAKLFNPQKFDAEQIVLLAKNAGMKYIVITSKHHDGFAMYKSNVSKYNIVDATPFKRDVIAEMAAACKKHDMAFGLYYSQAQDWHHTGGSAIGGHWDKAQDGDMDNYLDSIAVPQVTEILNNYGDIKVLWWDTPEGMTPERAARFLPELAKHPDLIYNNRLGGGIDGDLETPEQYIPATGIPGKNWESCMTMNDTWGFKKNDNNWKSTETIVRNLVDIASKGGNYLLNIGPTSEGLVPEASVKCLHEVGAWMKINGEAIYGTSANPFKKLDWGRCTQKKDGRITKLYLCVFNMPGDGKLIVPGLANKTIKAYPLVNTKQRLNISQSNADVVIEIAPVQKDDYVTVIVLEIEGEPLVYDAPDIEAAHSLFIDTAAFTIKSTVNGAIAKYSLNDSIYSDAWTEAKGPVSIGMPASFTVYATTVKDGTKISGVSKLTFIKEKPLAAKKVKRITKGLKYNYYEGKWVLLPDFSALKPIQTGIVPGVNLSIQKSKENYAIVYEGYLNIPQTGIFTFLLTSDDGSRLIIDDSKTLTNDGLHGMDEKSMDVSLEKGLHKVKVEFFQAGGGEGIILKWKYNDEKAVEIADSFYLN